MNSQSPQPDKTILFCGGGSGGHLYPALAVCEELQHQFPGSYQFQFFTTGRDIEAKVFAAVDVESIPIAAVTGRELSKRPFRAGWKLLTSIRFCRRKLRQIRPAIVVGLGGYGSIPGIIAAWSLGVPTLLMEQNIVPGRANQLLERFANTICVSFEETKNEFRKTANVIVSGNPVRRSILNVPQLDLESSPKVLLIVGGSQGAASINSAMQNVVNEHPKMLRSWMVFHQTGTDQNDDLANAYAQAEIDAEVVQFIENMDTMLARSSLVISRAGATTLAELAVTGRPVILIPYPKSVRDHQMKNAVFYAGNGAAIIVEEEDDPKTFFKRLANALHECAASGEQRKQMSESMQSIAVRDASRNVVNELKKLI